MNYAVVLNKNNSKDIFTHINIGERFFISYLYQDIKVGDYLFLCTYYPFDKTDKLLSVIKCKVVSYELSEKKDDCLFKTPKSCFRIELEYVCRQRISLKSSFTSQNKFRALTNELPNGKRKSLERIFNIEFDKEN